MSVAGATSGPAGRGLKPPNWSPAAGGGRDPSSASMCRSGDAPLLEDPAGAAPAGSYWEGTARERR